MSGNRVRIIGGEWRSRVLRFPDVPGLRPTPDRVRETVFNWLGQDLSGQACLDLFAGSGAFGLEAASRGARSVTLVERDRRVARSLEENARALDQTAGRITVACDDALEFLARDRHLYDVAFVDPPYALWDRGADAIATLLSRLRPRLEAQACVYLEAAQALQLPGDWETFKESRAGAVHFQLARPRAT
jgi:16S rRNA (guanine966-N2)-methyltransferase